MPTSLSGKTGVPGHMGYPVEGQSFLIPDQAALEEEIRATCPQTDIGKC